MAPSDPVPTVEPTLLAATFSPSGDLLHCNEAWTTALGPSESAWAHLEPDDRELATSSVLEAGRGRLVSNRVVSPHIPDRGEAHPVLLNFIPVYTSSNGAHSVSAVTITGEVMAEPPSWMTSQTQRHRMETLGRMTMGVAHDLNNLLSGLIGHVELLYEKLTAEVEISDPLQTSLRTIEQTAEDGAALIEKLQRYIRQDTEKHFERLDLCTLIEDCITLTQPYWYNEPRREGIEIEVVRSLSSVPDIKGSATELREVFVNLILNAVQAMPDGGTLTFETFVDDRGRACARIRDTGIGMTADVQENMFEPMFTTKGKQGTGMGLAASYGIVQEHEGDIKVTSTPDEGTEFILSFPPAKEHSPDATASTVDASEKQSTHVLIVDDEDMVRSIAEQLLSVNGHEVECAASGREALSKLGESSFDIVFTDFGMPEMTGAELSQLIREAYPNLPVVLLTGYTDTEAAVENVDAILSKPFKLEELETLIQEHVFSS
ncbi:MAG: response regulator [Salinibacter sp.]